MNATGTTMKPFAMLAGALAALSLAAAVAAQPASPAPTPAALEQARHLIQTMHAAKLYDQLISAMESSMIASMTKNLPEAKQQRVQAIEDGMFEEMRGLMPKLTDQMAVIYATDFTEQELTDMDRFYASPTGQSMLEKTPRISQQLIPFVMAEMPSMLGRAFDRSCQKTACTTQQREAMARALDALRARTASQPS